MRTGQQRYIVLIIPGCYARLPQESVQEKRSESPNRTGCRDLHGENALISAAVAAGTSYASGALSGKYGGNTDMTKAMFGDILSTGTNVLVEYGKQQTWGKDKSGYDALGRPDMGRFGALAGSLGIAAYKDHKAAELKAAREAEIAQADKLAREGNKQKAIEILMAGGYFKDRKDAEAYVLKVKAQAEGLPEGDLVKDSKGNFFVRDKDGILHPLPKGSQSRLGGVELAMPEFMSDSTEYIRAWAKTMERAAAAWHHDLWDIPEENTGSGRPGAEPQRNVKPGNDLRMPADPDLPLDNPVYREDLYKRIEISSQDIRGLQIAARGRVDIQPVIDGILRQRFTPAEIKVYNQVAPKLGTGPANWERVSSGFTKTFYYELAKLGSHVVTGIKYALGAGGDKSYSDYYDSDPRNTYIAAQILRLEERHKNVQATLLFGDDYEKSMIEAHRAGMDYLHGEMGAEGLILIGSLGVEGAVSRVVTRSLARAALGGLTGLSAGERKLVEAALSRAQTAAEKQEILDVFRRQLTAPPASPSVQTPSSLWNQSTASSAKLADNLGIPKGSGLDAHHIVAGELAEAQQARNILNKYQIDINAADNGVALVGGKGAPRDFLPRHHRGGGSESLHSTKGARMVNERLQDAVRGIQDWATARKAVLEELTKIRREITFGVFP